MAKPYEIAPEHYSFRIEKIIFNAYDDKLDILEIEYSNNVPVINTINSEPIVTSGFSMSVDLSPDRVVGKFKGAYYCVICTGRSV